MITATALETRMNFLFKKQTELYQQYSEGSISKEKFIVVQEGLQSSSLCELAGKGGAWL